MRQISFGRLSGAPCEDDTESSCQPKDREFLDLLRDFQLDVHESVHRDIITKATKMQLYRFIYYS